MKLLERRRNLIGAFARFVLKVLGKPPLTLEACVNDKSTIDYKVYGESVQDGTPTPNAPVEVESVGEKTINLFNPSEAVLNGGTIDGNTIMATNIDYYLKAGIYTIAFTTVGISGVFFRKGQVSSGYFGSCTTKDNNYACATINFTEDGYLRISHFEKNGGIKDIMLVEGNRYGNMPNYEPYSKYKIPIVASGKNLYPDSSYKCPAQFNNYYTFIQVRSTNIINLLQSLVGKAIAFSYSIDNEAFKGKEVIVYFDDGSYSMFSNENTMRLPIGKTVNYLEFRARSESSKANGLTATIFNIQLEVVNGKRTDYEPYQEPITTNIYLDEPLRKIGDYADYIDFENQVVVRNIKRVDLKNANNTYSWIGKNGVTFYVLDKNYTRNNKALCNRNYYWTANGGEKTTMWLGVESRSLFWIGILDYLGFTTKEELNEWLVNNPTYLLYGSDLPIETPIELPQLPTFKGTTIYSVDTNIQPSNMEVTYYSKERSVS